MMETTALRLVSTSFLTLRGVKGSIASPPTKLVTMFKLLRLRRKRHAIYANEKSLI